MDVIDDISIVHEILPTKKRKADTVNLCTKKKKQPILPKKMWVNPLLSERLTSGFFHCKHAEFREDPSKFFEFYHMSPASFDKLCDTLRPYFKLEATLMRKPIPIEERIAVTIRFLASGCTYTELMYEFRIGISTVSLIVKDVCTKISNHLKEMVMPEPNSEKWSEIADGFYKRSDFPNCIGAMDAKRLKVAYNTGKRKDGEKNGFCCSTFVVLAICDSNYLFTDFDIIQYNHTDFKGQLRDPDLFGNTVIGKKLYNNEMNLPNSRPLPETNDPDMPFVLVADKAFGLSRNVMRPYCVANFQNQKSRVFNYRLSRARRFIECTFAILSNKWDVFHRTLNASSETANRIVQACIILHNFVLIRDGYCFEDTVQIDGFGDVTNVSPATQMTGLSKFYRNKFANYFLSPEGERKWQYTRI